MALEVGSIIEGTVTGLAKFGVFVDLGDKKTGLVHISEVASEYVSDVNDYLKMRDKVKVKVLSIDDKGKIALSIKQAQSGEDKETNSKHSDKEYANNRHGQSHENRESFQGRDNKSSFNARNDGYRGNNKKSGNPVSFEDKLSRFLKDSDKRLLDLKRNVESKRGGRGAKRSD